MIINLELHHKHVALKIKFLESFEIKFDWKPRLGFHFISEQKNHFI